MSFVERHGLWTAEQRAAARELVKSTQSRGIEVVRFSFADQHGILRGKTITAAELPRALEDGVTVTTTLFAKGEVYRLRAEDRDAERALAAYARALETKTAPPETLRGTMLVELKTGARDRARVAFEAYLRARPDAPDAEALKMLLSQ
jgi:hypothetical protein